MAIKGTRKEQPTLNYASETPEVGRSHSESKEVTTNDPILWTRAGLDSRRRFGDQPLRKGNVPSTDRMNKMPMRWGSNE